MSTSGTYNFSSPTLQQIIDEAFERIKVPPTEITEQKIKSAIRSVNFILQEWVSRGNNLWTIHHGMIGLNPNQNAYFLPQYGIDIKTAAIRTSNRILGGTASSVGGGIASSAFDNNTDTSCTQLQGLGANIGYSWSPSSNSISMVGIQSNFTTEWDISCQYSNDNGVTWNEFLSINENNLFPIGQIQWFVVPQPQVYGQVRIVNEGSGNYEITYSQMTGLYSEYGYETYSQTGGTVPFNIQELYFNSNISDTIVSALSEFEYTSIPNKNQTGRPTSYWVDRKIAPIIYLWPTPISYYNNLYFTYWKAIQDAGSMLNNAEIPTRFIEPLTAALAYRLCIKHGTADMVEILKSESEESYKVAAMEDRERVPLRIYGDYTQGWGRV